MNNIKMRQEIQEILISIEGDKDLVSPKFAEWWSGYLRRHSYRYLDTLSFLDDDDIDRNILELGSVPGHMTVLLERLKYKIRGVDIDPSRAGGLWDKYGLKVDKVDIEKDMLPFPPDSFEIVLFCEILEHLRLNPLHVLREAYRVLKPGGRIILSTPNITPLHRIGFLFGRDYQGDPVEEFRKLEWLGHMGHIRLYAEGEIRNFIRNAGFTVCSHAYKGVPFLHWRGNLFRFLHPKKDCFNKILYIIAKK